MTTRKLLLLGTILTAFSVGPAMAADHSSDPIVPTFETSIATATAANNDSVNGNSAVAVSQGTFTSITGGSYNNAKGVSNQNQNAGANSALQNALALSYIQGCACTTGTGTGTGTSYTTATGQAVASSGNDGYVGGNSSSSDRAGGSLIPFRLYGPNSTVSADIDGSYNSATGVFQVNQNSGANSLLQNSAAVAVATQLKGATLDQGSAVASAGNDANVQGNRATDNWTNAGGTINNAFNNVTGVVNVNQNVGENSALQNASSLASLQFCGCATDNYSMTVAAAGNGGLVLGNTAIASNGSNGAIMNASFNGAQGMLQANQNAGANSALQNSVAVGSIVHTAP